MSRSLVRSRAGLRALAAGALLATTVAAQSSGVVFRGLNHTPVGSATLTLDTSDDTLLVRTRDVFGRDGVRAHLSGQTTSWTARLRPTISDTRPFNMTLTAGAEGQPISSAVIRQDGAKLRVSARFTGSPSGPSPYAVQVYDDGRLVGAQGSTNGSTVLDWEIQLCKSVPEFCEFTSDFHNGVFGECLWRIAAASGRDMQFELPDGRRLTGDELRLIEEVNPAGHYPYLSFDALTMQTSAPVLTLLSETVR